MHSVTKMHKYYKRDTTENTASKKMKEKNEKFANLNIISNKIDNRIIYVCRQSMSLVSFKFSSLTSVSARHILIFPTRLSATFASQVSNSIRSLSCDSLTVSRGGTTASCFSHEL